MLISEQIALSITINLLFDNNQDEFYLSKLFYF